MIMKLGLQSGLDALDASDASMSVWHKVLAWAPARSTGFSIVEIEGIGHLGAFVVKFHFGMSGFSYPLPLGRREKEEEKRSRFRQYIRGEGTDIITEISNFCDGPVIYDTQTKTYYKPT